MSTTTAARDARLDLPIEGMTCAACAARIERGLNRLEGVEASVNYATEAASVRYDPAVVTPEQLVATVERSGYHARLPTLDAAAEPERDPAAANAAALRLRLIWSASLTAPLILLSMLPALQFSYWQWLALQLATPVVLWGGWPFHRAAWLNLRHRAATMDTLISLGTLVAYGWSVWALFLGGAGEAGMTMEVSLVPQQGGGADALYLEVAAGVVTFMLAGRYLEARAKRTSGAALRALLKLGAKDAALLDDDGKERRIPIAELGVGDRFVVRPGERVAADGAVEQGSSAVDQSIVTGESAPVEVGPGSPVIGGSVNSGGRLVVRAERVGADTMLAQIGRLVAEAQSGKAPIQRLADRVAGVFVPVVIGIALATLVGWLASGAATAFAVQCAVAVLVIACPCALGLATPTALLVGTGRGAQLGILVKGPEVLEASRQIDTVVLDKTGTITEGRMQVASIATDGVDEAELLRCAGALEHASEHPLGRAVAAAASERLGALAEVQGFQAAPGRGARGTVDGRDVAAGSLAWLGGLGVSSATGLEAAAAAELAQGRTVVYVALDGAVRGMIAIEDAVRPTSAEAVRRLVGLGLRPIMLTGDAAATARAVAEAVGIEEVAAEVLPADKERIVRELQADGRVVAMVGDGVNDAPALARADLGIAIGVGADVAIEASDLTLVRADLRGVSDAVRLARRTFATIRVNLFWAFAYNIAALPLAALGYLNPLIAGLAMALSSLFVVGNSLRLRRFRPGS